MVIRPEGHNPMQTPGHSLTCDHRTPAPSALPGLGWLEHHPCTKRHEFNSSASMYGGQCFSQKTSETGDDLMKEHPSAPTTVCIRTVQVSPHKMHR